MQKQKSLIAIYFIGAVINVVFNLVFIPRYSYIAASYATFITEAVVTLLMIRVVYKSINFLPSIGRLFKYAIAAAIMAIIIYKLSYLNIFFLLILSPLLYFIILFLIKGIIKEEIFEIINRKITN